VVRLVVTGCARSGTQWISQVFAGLGLRAEHEYSLNLAGYTAEKAEHLDIEVSWLAAPLLDDVPVGTIVWHQIRDPRKVIRCCLHNHYFAEETCRAPDTRDFIKEHISIPDNASMLEAACRYWYLWNKKVEPYADSWYTIEEMNAWNMSVRLKTFGFDFSEEQVHTAIDGVVVSNACMGDHSPESEVSWEDILKTNVGSRVQQLARKYGYAC